MTEQRYPTATREDLIRIIDLANSEIDAATTAIIKAVETAATGDPDAAVKVIARYVLDNGHVREATDTTLGRLFTLTDPDPNNPVGFEQALNTWEAAWEDNLDIYIGAPTPQDDATAAQAIRELIAAGHEQHRILQAARTAGATYSADIAHHLVRDDREAK